MENLVSVLQISLNEASAAPRPLCKFLKLSRAVGEHAKCDKGG